MTASGQLTFNAEESAAIIGGDCKPSWLKEKARLGLIPVTLIAGRYCWTMVQLEEIVKNGARTPSAEAAASRSRKRPEPAAEPPAAASVTLLQVREPRRMRKAS